MTRHDHQFFRCPPRDMVAQVVEIGCGTGCAGLAAAALGAEVEPMQIASRICPIGKWETVMKQHSGRTNIWVGWLNTISCALSLCVQMSVVALWAGCINGPK